MHIAWYAGHCRIIDLDLHYNAMYWGKLKLNIWLTILRFIPNLIIRGTIYEVKFIICVPSICDLQMSSNFSPAKKFPWNSAELYGNLFCRILWNSRKELERYFRTFPLNFRTFQQNGKILWKCTEIRGESISVRKCAELYGNRWNKTVRKCAEIRYGWDLGLYWLFNLILTAVKMQKKTIVKSC